MRKIKLNKAVQGSILILVLWLTTLGLILVTAIASNIRLSATTVLHHQEALQDWSAILETINKARMELLIDKMPRLESQETELYNRKGDENWFDGRPLKLKYPAASDITVRFYDLSGKLNISRINQQQIQQLLAHLLGEDNKQIPELVDAWLDWIDTDELKRLNGAEKEYYLKHELGYIPRNGPLASVEELRLIKGFDKVFSDIDLDSVFTLYGGRLSVNPNIASKEALMMLPGMDISSAEEILAARKKLDFKNISDLNLYLKPSVLAKASGWFSFSQSNYYSIVVYPTALEDQQLDKQTIYAYREDVRVTGPTVYPEVLKVDPYAKIKVFSHEREQL